MIRLLAALRGVLIVLTGFLALSAIPGGIALLAGVYAPPVQQLEGSVFSSFFVPGLVLLVAVGGSALLAFVLLTRRKRFGTVMAGLAGACVMTFEFVEVLAIGSPPGPAFVMQALYFGIGLGLVCISLPFLLYSTDALSVPQGQADGGREAAHRATSVA